MTSHNSAQIEEVRARTALQNSPGSIVTSVVSGLKRCATRCGSRSGVARARSARAARGGSWRANATGRTNRSPRSRSPPRRRQDDDDAFDGLDALGEAAVISQLTDSLSSEQFVLDPPGREQRRARAPVLAVTPPALEPAPIKVAYSPDGYGEPGATTIIQRSYDDVVHTPRRLSIDGDDPLEGDDGVWGQYLELDETESAQRVPALIVVPYLSPPIDIAPTSPTTRRSSNF